MIYDIGGSMHGGSHREMCRPRSAQENMEQVRRRGVSRLKSPWELAGGLNPSVDEWCLQRPMGTCQLAETRKHHVTWSDSAEVEPRDSGAHGNMPMGWISLCANGACRSPWERADDMNAAWAAAASTRSQGRRTPRPK